MTEPAIDFKTAFNALPGNFLILKPDAPFYTILAVSDELLEVTSRNRKAIVGKSLFEVYPEKGEAISEKGALALKASLQHAIQHKKQDHIPCLRYELADARGVFEERYWSVTHKPVLDSEGKVAYLIHSTTEMREQPGSGKQSDESNRRLEEQVKVRTEELQTASEQIERERNLLQTLFNQAPVALGLFKGQELEVVTANQSLCDMWGHTPDEVLNRPLLEGVPEFKDQGFDDILRGALNSGKPYIGMEMPARLLRAGKLETNYFTFINQALYDAEGNILGVVAVATEVTELVLARKAAEERELKLQSLNAELVAINEELTATNEELSETQKALKQLNSRLEERVEERTIAVKSAKAETQRQVEVLHELIMQAPEPIAILEGENMVYTLVNPAYQQVFPERELKGRAIMEVFSELKNAPLRDYLEKVYQTGETFVGHETPILLARHQGGSLEELYFNFTLQARRKEAGEIDGIFVFAHEVTEQVKDRKKTEASEQHIRSLIEGAPFPLAVYRGKELRIEMANQAMITAYGKGPDVVGRLYAEVLSEMPSEVYKRLEEVLATGVPFHARNECLEVVMAGKPQAFYYNYSFTPLCDAQGMVYGVMNTAADVTELNLAHKKIEESEKTLKNIFAHAPVAVAIFVGPDFTIELANEKVLEYWGRSMEQVIHKPLFEALPEAAGQGFEELLSGVLTSGEPFIAKELSVELERNNKLERTYINFVYEPYRNGEGSITGVIVVANEITEQVTARKEIEHSQEALKRFKFMADQARDAFILMRKDGTFAYLNQKAQEAWGYSEEEISHLRVPDVDPVYQEEQFVELFNKAQQGTVPQIGTLHKRKDGEVIPVEVNMVGLKLEGKPYLFAVARDIRERKKSEEKLKLQNEQLQRINNDLDNFIYTASHDLKAPITNIEGLMQVLLQKLPAETMEGVGIQKITGMIHESVERFKKTIESLTDVVKLQKEHSGEAVSVDLAVVVKEVQLDMEAMIRESGVQLIIDVAHCPAIRFPEKNLRSVVYNLLSNAIKYHSPERLPKVEISCDSNSEYEVLVIKDNGIGIRKRSLDQLFTMFKRFHSHVEGTGVGLYMVKKMIENAGGHIEVESEEGEGTTFRVYFPR